MGHSLQPLQRLTLKLTQPRLPSLVWSMTFKRSTRPRTSHIQRTTSLYRLIHNWLQRRPNMEHLSSSQPKIAEIELELVKWEKMRPIEEMNKEEAIAQMPHLANQLKIRDPAQHKHSIGPEYTETVDQWEARMVDRQVLLDAEGVEAEERAKKERAKMGLDY